VVANRPATVHPVWQLLSSVYHSGQDATLTYEKCCAVLDYYADRLAAGADPGEVGRMVTRALQLCPDCLVRCVDWLDEMEPAA
jgi:hypothetical protein